MKNYLLLFGLLIIMITVNSQIPPTNQQMLLKADVYVYSGGEESVGSHSLLSDDEMLASGKHAEDTSPDFNSVISESINFLEDRDHPRPGYFKFIGITFSLIYSDDSSFPTTVASASFFLDVLHNYTNPNYTIPGFPIIPPVKGKDYYGSRGRFDNTNSSFIFIIPKNVSAPGVAIRADKRIRIFTQYSQSFQDYILNNNLSVTVNRVTDLGPSILPEKDYFIHGIIENNQGRKYFLTMKIMQGYIFISG